MRTLGPALAMILLASCHNPCQRVCIQMKTFAEDCGYVVPDAQLDACLDEQDAASNDDKDLCRDAGDLGAIERVWDCDSIAEYWAAAGT